MRFGASLKARAHRPWRESYLDYDRLKGLLRENESNAGWREQDESAFVAQLDVQLEKVYAFQHSTFQELKERIAQCETCMLNGSGKSTMLELLDQVIEDVKQLERFSRLNYSGFLKIAKKHDRHHPQYSVRPLLHVRMLALPFYSEDYGPLLLRLSALYAMLNAEDAASVHTVQKDARLVVHKLWVHPEHQMEVKTIILRRLPLLIYNPQGNKYADGSLLDMSMSSLYFDNDSFDLYHSMLEGQAESQTLCMNSFGDLSDMVYFESCANNIHVRRERMAIEKQYARNFICGKNALNTSSSQHARPSAEAESMRQHSMRFASLIQDKQLKPKMRVNLVQAAFQVPGDDRIRILMDSDLTFVRESHADLNYLYQSPKDWFRNDLEGQAFFADDEVEKVIRFPFAHLQITVNASEEPTWVTDLLSSRLVKEVPQFSTFLHGMSVLYDQSVNLFPFWLPLIDEEYHAAMEQVEHEPKLTIGSLVSENIYSAIMDKGKSKEVTGSDDAGASSYISVPEHERFRTLDDSSVNISDSSDDDDDDDNDQLDDGDEDESDPRRPLLPAKSALSRDKTKIDLPPAVQKPESLIIHSGPNRVEAKVWLANERTFLKWQHISILIAVMSIGLFNTMGKAPKLLGVAYFMLAAFAATWGWIVYQHRISCIKRWDDKHLDRALGPWVICIGLVLCLSGNCIYIYTNGMKN